MVVRDGDDLAVHDQVDLSETALVQKELAEHVRCLQLETEELRFLVDELHNLYS